MGRIVLNPGIFGVRNECCGKLDQENAGSWYSNMLVSHKYSCCITVMTSGLQFAFNCTICMGSVSIFLTIRFHFLFAFFIIHHVVLWGWGPGFLFALFLRCLCWLRNIGQPSHVSGSSAWWLRPLHGSCIFE